MIWDLRHGVLCKCLNVKGLQRTLCVVAGGPEVPQHHLLRSRPVLGSMSLRLHKSSEAPKKRKKEKENHVDREQDGVCAGQGEHKYTFNFPGRFSGAGPVPEGCASFPNVSPGGAETQFVWGLSRPVWAPLDGEEP